MAPDMTPEEKKDLFDATGQLKGGYDMGMAQAFAIEHAKKIQGEYVRERKQRIPLIWNIDSSRYDEDAECFKVVLSCHPEGIEAQQKGMWEYHVRSTGGLMPGTPLLRQSLRYTLPRVKKRSPWVAALVVLLLLAVLGGGGVAAAMVLAPGLIEGYVPWLATATPTPPPSATATPRPLPTVTPSRVPSPTPVPTRLPTAVAIATATAAPRPTPTLPRAPTATAVPAPLPTASATPRPVPTATAVPIIALTPKPTLAPTATTPPLVRPTLTPTPAVAASRVLVSFNGLATGTLPATALAPFGIWISSGSVSVSPVEPKSQVVPAGVTQIAQFLGPDFPKVLPTCATLVFNNPLSATSTNAQVVTLTSFSVTRIGTLAGGSYPAWRLRAFDAQGKQVGADVGEGPIPNTTGYFAMTDTAKDFAVVAPGIAKVELCSHNTLSTYGAIPIARMGYTK